MFYYKYSKLTRWTIVLNAIYAVISIGVNVYHYINVRASHKMITAYMSEHQVIWETAVRALQKSGEVLHFSDASIVVNINLAIVTLIFLFFFRKNDTFLLTMLTALSCTLLNFIGGAFLFYLVFANLLESGVHADEFHVLKNEKK